MLRKILCVAPQRNTSADPTSEVPYEATTVTTSTRHDELIPYPSGPDRAINHYHTRPVATLSEAEEQRAKEEERRRKQQQEQKSKDKSAPGELEIDSAYSLHVALGRMLVVSASLVASEQPSISLINGHLQLIEEYDNLANKKRKASADYSRRNGSVTSQ